MERQFPVQDILHYWFGTSVHEPAELERQSKRWFAGGQALDHEIQMRFGELIKPLSQRGLDAVASADDALAAVLLFDQFPRHVYRGQAQAFAFDDKAFAVLQRALDKAWQRELHPVQQSFLYMPLQHAESLEAQNQAVELYRQLAQEVGEGAPEALRRFVQQAVEYACLHREIIAKFGRFPHRNRALGRHNSAEEEAYLTHGRRFGQ